MEKRLDLIIISFGLIVSIYLILSYENTDTVMLGDPLSFDNLVAVENLSTTQKQALVNSLNLLFSENCEYRELDEKCSLQFLHKYMFTRELINFYIEAPIEPANRDILLDIYSDLESSYGRMLSEQDLNNTFLHSVIRDMCVIGIFNRTVASDWTERFINIEKTSWKTTSMQLYFVLGCSQVYNFTEIFGESLRDKICTVLPTVRDMDLSDICLVRDYVVTKAFCKVPLSQEEKDMIYDSISAEPEDGYESECKIRLSQKDIQFYMLGDKVS